MGIETLFDAKQVPPNRICLFFHIIYYEKDKVLTKQKKIEFLDHFSS